MSRKVGHGDLLQKEGGGKNKGRINWEKEEVTLVLLPPLL